MNIGLTKWFLGEVDFWSLAGFGLFTNYMSAAEGGGRVCEMLTMADAANATKGLLGKEKKEEKKVAT